MVNRIRIHDVAELAGVSTATVSQALNGRGKIRDETRARVRAAARELGYAPNRIASALRLQRTHILGFVSDKIATSPFAGRIVLGAQEAAAEAGLTLMMVNSDRDVLVERRHIDSLIAQQVDGLLYATMDHRRVTAPAVPADVPLVLVNATDPQSRVPAVVPDEHALAYTATCHLLELGHREIVHLTVTGDGPAVEGRIAGYTAAMRNAGRTAHTVHAPPGPASTIGGRAAAREAITRRPSLTAFFCFNDPIAMGAYQIAADFGLQIPDQLSIIGVDDIETIAPQLRPALTTLALPHYEMGRWAAETLIQHLAAGGPSRGEVKRLHAPFVIRDSVTAAPRAALSS